MSNLDDRIISLGLNDSDLQSGVNRVTSTLSKLSAALKMKDAKNGLDDVSKSANNVNLDTLQSSVESVRNQFSTLRLVAIGALSNVANRAISTGASMLKALTIAPIMDGFREYETQMNSVQTILANTASKGSTIKDVNKSLSELNTYADKTIYNFTEMTRNIGTFTAAGVDLKTSTESIKGIANLAAVSGSNSQQASTAMYQLSQAIASGTVRLMDWNSVVNAGMGGEVFQNALIRTSEHLKTGAKAAIAAKGSFRESLSEGWLTTKVLTDTLNQFQLSVDSAEDYNNAIKSLVSQGYTQQEAKAIADMAKTAGDAATKVKTFSQLIDTLKEAVGSGWTNSFQAIFGDFVEARESWTSISNILSDLVNKSSAARNEVLNGWGKLGGRKELFGTFTDSIKLVLSYMEPLKQGFRDIFPAITAQQLYNITKGFHDFIKSITLSTDQMSRLRTAIRGILSPLGLIRDGFSAVFSKLMPHAGSASAKAINIIISALSIVGSILQNVTDVARAFATGIASGFGKLGPIVDIVRRVSNAISNFVSSMSKASGSFNFLEVLEQGFTVAGEKIGNALRVIQNAISSTFNWITNNISFGDIFKVLAGGGTLAIGKKIYDLVKNLNGVVDKVKGIFTFGKEAAEEAKASASIFTGILDSLSNTLKAFTQGIRIGSLVAIATAILELSYAMKTISDIDTDKVIKSLVAISAMFVLLSRGLKSITGILTGFEGKGLLTAGVTLILLAKSINMLADAMGKIAALDIAGITKGLITIKVLISSMAGFLSKTDLVVSSLKSGVMLVALAKAIQMLANAMTDLASLSWEGIAKGLVGIVSAMYALSGAMNLMSGTRVPLRTSVAMIAMAYSLKQLGDVLVQVASLSWDQIGRSLTGVVGVMGTMALVLKSLSKNSGFGSIVGATSMLIMAQMLMTIGNALSNVARLSWEEIGKGITGIATTLGIMKFILKGLNKSGAFESIASAASLVIMATMLEEIGVALSKVARLSWEEIGKGLTGIVIALSSMKSVLKALNKLNGFQEILSSVSLVIVASTLEDIGNALVRVARLSWDEVGRGLVAFAGAMGTMAIVMKALGKVSGFKALLASVDLIVISQSLGNIASALAIVGKVSWSGIGAGLIGLGGVLAEMATISGLFGKLAGFSGLIGAAGIVIAAQSLGEIGSALKVVGSLSWSEIGRGLTGIGGALTELAVVSGLLGSLSGGLSIVGAGSILVAVQSLDKLAEGLGKFAEYSWDDIKRGLTAMGSALGVLAGGTFVNTFGILGSLSIAKVAEPLGVLADSIGKWAHVKVPGGLKKSLSELASGLRGFLFTGFGSANLAAAAPAVGKLADSIKKWAGVKVPSGLKNGLKDLGDGLKSFSLQFTSGMNLGNAVGAIGGLAGAIGKWKNVKFPSGLKQGLWDLKDGIGAFTLQFSSGSNLNNIVDPISKLPDALSKWDKVKVPKDLAANLKSISEAMGSFTWQFSSGFNLGNVVDPISKIPDALAKWSNVKLPPNLKETLWEIKDGIGAFVSQFTSGFNLGNIVGPLGDLASAINKWANVKVPTDLKQGLWDIKDGVGAFQLEFFTGGNLNSIAGPLGAMAGAITKWANVKVPTGLKESLTEIRDGVGAFQWEFFTGGNLNSVVGPLGAMASAITKWANVKVPTGLKDSLTEIRDGVGAFQWEFFTGGNLNSVVGPLGAMAGAVTKWANVKVPAGLKDSLTDIRDGVGGFQWEFFTGGNLNSIVGPLGAMAGAIKKWNGITIPSNLKQGLIDLKDGVGAFQWEFFTGGNLNSIAGPLGAMAGAIKKWNGISVPNGIKSSLEDIAKGVNAFSGVNSGEAINNIVKPLAGLASSVSAWSAVIVPDSLGSNLKAIKTGVAGFDKLNAAGSAMTSLIGPLGGLASSVAKWAGIQSVTNISTALSGLKEAAEGFQVGKNFGASASTFKQGLTNIATSISILAGVDTAGPIAKLKAFVESYNGLDTLDTEKAPNLNKITKSLSTAISSLGTISWVDLSIAIIGVNQLKTFVTTLSSIDGLVFGTFKASISSLGDLGIGSLAISVSSASATLSSVMSTLVSIISTSAAQLFMASMQLRMVMTTGFTGMSNGIANEFSIAANTVIYGSMLIVVALSNTAVMIGAYANRIPASMAAMSFGLTLQMAIARSSVASGSAGITQAFAQLLNVVAQFAMRIPSAMLPMISGLRASLNMGLQTIASYNGQYHAHGINLMTNLTNGVRAGGGGLIAAAVGHLQGAANALRGYYGGFYSAGIYVASGFANGISAGSNSAINAAAKMGADAIAAARHATDEHSPSKKAFKIGHFVGEGMANGVTESTKLVSDSATHMGNTALGSLTDAMGTTSGQSIGPKISPVFDMSSLKTGTRAISNAMANSGVSLLNGHISVPNVEYKDPRVTALAQYQNQMVQTNAKTIDKLDMLSSDLKAYHQSLSEQELAMYVDGKKLASTTAKYTNQELGKLQRRGQLNR